MTSRLPLELYAQVTTASGVRYRWDANQDPGSRPRNLSFSTKIGEGFSSGQTQLARRIDLDYPDLSLVDDVAIIGADGSIAFEGRISAMPREQTDSQSIGVTLTGWMAHAKDRKFTEIYVDRDLSGWGAMSTRRRANLLTQTLPTKVMPNDPSTMTDASNGAAVSTSWQGGWPSTISPMSEAWYDAGPGNLIGRVGYSWTRGANVSNADAQWQWGVIASSDDQSGSWEWTGNLRAAGPSLLQLFTPAAARRYAALQLQYNANADATGFAAYTWNIDWTKLAVYGNHQLPLYAGEAGEPSGVRASDVIRNIAARWCPQLSTAGVQDTSYVIQHLVFKNRTYPYDAFLEINKYHLWFLGVWEGRELTFRPYDLTDYQWQIRTDQPGVQFSPQGPSVDDLFDGIAVTYTDMLTGVKGTLEPTSYPELRTIEPANPWVSHATPHWDEIELSTPTTLTAALQLGRAALADRNTPKTPGTITVTGYIEDRQGNEQPAWKVRAGDTVIIGDFPNDQPRLIVETSYDDTAKTLTMSIDRPMALVDAYLDRLANAVGARGL